MNTSQLPSEFTTFKELLATKPREEIEKFISLLWLQFNVEKLDTDDFSFNPDKEVGGADLVEWVGDQLSNLHNKGTYKLS